MVTEPPFNVEPRPTVNVPETVEPDAEQVAFGGTTTFLYEPNGRSPRHIVIGAAGGVGAA
jgi:hypothetical protein